MKSDNEKIKGDTVMFLMRVVLFFLGLIGLINIARLVIPKVVAGDSAVYYFLTGSIGIVVAVFMMLGAVAGKWPSSKRSDKRVQGLVAGPQHVLTMEDLKQLERSRDLLEREERVRRNAGSRAS